ncbi:hypothetical protein [Breznakiella homolactica]|uniref:Uncharacterized protein n=1 Tax=Breznakiella homolactica TaxID=2798577 RepID=A0A7T8B9C0_9SPIR|nr:hypothetical protein [Breznakiella homolactica]QQO07805.1 hypothetical protein JFL75_12740 [Breznakiella homolactica]
MFNQIKTYKLWAPDNAVWTAWAKPVLFATIPVGVPVKLVIPKIGWIQSAEKNTMVILDLPEKRGVEEALALAGLGYRPVPLYNGVFGPSGYAMAVDVSGIAKALYQGAVNLQDLRIPGDAPPAFMLDSSRMDGYSKPMGRYDNRWCVFPQDMPSAAFLVQRGIKRIIVRAGAVASDLSHILCRYQEQGIGIYLCGDSKKIRPVTVSKPSEFKSLMYRFKVTLGLTRNAAGGFGGYVPEPTQSGSGVRYYGMG